MSCKCTAGLGALEPLHLLYWEELVGSFGEVVLWILMDVSESTTLYNLPLAGSSCYKVTCVREAADVMK